MFQKALSIALILALVAPVFAQAVQPKPDSEELQKEAVTFLRETMGDVQNMRTLENRISFSAELAGLMWYHDEAEAKTMFNAAISDFRELISRLDAQMMAIPDDAEMDGVGIFTEGSDRRKFEMKYRVAMAVRQQIATSIAEHDPDIALSFFHDTASTNPKMASMGGRDTTFEINLLKEIASKSPSKASQYGLKSLEKGLDSQHIDLLRKIYEKDADVAVEFGAAVLKKAKSKKPSSYEFYLINALLEYGSQNLDESKSKGRRAIFAAQDLRELADFFGQSILDLEGKETINGMQYVTSIERFSPSRARQIKTRIQRESGLTESEFGNWSSNGANRGIRTYSNSNAMSNANFAAASPSSNSNSTSSSDAQEARRAAEAQLAADVAKLGKGELPKEERDKVVAQARKILMQDQGKDKQIMGLSMLASQVAKSGDKQLAAEIMRDAEALVNPQLKNYQDFLYTWLVVSGYAESDPDKAFPILESAIGRANELISAFVKVGEFIDVTEEMISDGEAQVGAFGGGMIRGLSKELGVAEATIGTLIAADFAKTRALTNRFERPEVRVLAKVLVLRSALGKKPEASAGEQVRKVMGQN